jgi:hypothetical protein
LVFNFSLKIFLTQLKKASQVYKSFILLCYYEKKQVLFAEKKDK